MADNPPLHVYCHVATMGTFWREVVSELVGEIKGSRLFDAAASLTAIYVGDGSLIGTPMQGHKWRNRSGGGLLAYEYPTLKHLWKHAYREPQAYFLYLHTKGVRTEDGKEFRALWREWMSYFLVTRWRESVEKLAEFDTVGSHSKGGHLPHYAGNFWWARGDWLTKLPEPAPKEFGPTARVHAEFWLMDHDPRPRSFCWGQPDYMFESVADGRMRRDGAPLAT